MCILHNSVLYFYLYMRAASPLRRIIDYHIYYNLSYSMRKGNTIFRNNKRTYIRRLRHIGSTGIESMSISLRT